MDLTYTKYLGALKGHRLVKAKDFLYQSTDISKDRLVLLSLLVTQFHYKFEEFKLLSKESL
jgi:hypothetical protein